MLNRTFILKDKDTNVGFKRHLHFTEKEKAAVLKRFMKEFFPYGPLRKAGFFTKEMRGDYKAQAERVCQFFGYETVYEYGVTAKHTTDNNGFSYKMESIYQ